MLDVGEIKFRDLIKNIKVHDGTHSMSRVQSYLGKSEWDQECGYVVKILDDLFQVKWNDVVDKAYGTARSNRL